MKPNRPEDNRIFEHLLNHYTLGQIIERLLGPGKVNQAEALRILVNKNGKLPKSELLQLIEKMSCAEIAKHNYLYLPILDSKQSAKLANCSLEKVKRATLAGELNEIHRKNKQFKRKYRREEVLRWAMGLPVNAKLPQGSMEDMEELLTLLATIIGRFPTGHAHGS